MYLCRFGEYKIVVLSYMICPRKKSNDGGYQVDGGTIASFFIKTPNNIFSYGVLHYDKNLAYKLSVNVQEVP